MAYQTIYEESNIENEIKRSRFIGRAAPVQTQEEAELFIKEIKDNEPQATHHCSCYCIGENMLIQRYSDDGEPKGTAGIPMLEVLKKSKVTNVVVVVTRYFGGIKLGASGLVRAYTGTCQDALSAGKIVTYIPFQEVDMSFDYSNLGKIDYYIQKNKLFENKRSYDENVNISLLLNTEDVKKIKSDIFDELGGKIVWNEKEIIDMAVDENNEILKK